MREYRRAAYGNMRWKETLEKYFGDLERVQKMVSSLSETSFNLQQKYC